MRDDCKMPNLSYPKGLNRKYDTSYVCEKVKLEDVYE